MMRNYAMNNLINLYDPQGQRRISSNYISHKSFGEMQKQYLSLLLVACNENAENSQNLPQTNITVANNRGFIDFSNRGDQYLPQNKPNLEIFLNGHGLYVTEPLITRKEPALTTADNSSSSQTPLSSNYGDDSLNSEKNMDCELKLLNQSKKIYKSKGDEATKSKKKSHKKSKKTSNRRTRALWKPDEDAIVIKLVSHLGFKWSKIADALPLRTGKQVRDRYLNNLQPNIKPHDWTIEEDELFMSLYKTYGKKWCKIASFMPGRTESQTKNRFYAHIKHIIRADSCSKTIWDSCLDSLQDQISRPKSFEESPKIVDSANIKEESEIAKDELKLETNGFYPFCEASMLKQEPIMEHDFALLKKEE